MFVHVRTHHLLVLIENSSAPKRDNHILADNSFKNMKK